jgi:drug/metabolite transporter (DMT)-like permease
MLNDSLRTWPLATSTRPGIVGRVSSASTSRRTDVVLLLVAIVWGSSYLTAKSATAALPVLLVLFGRYALSALGCLGVLGVRRQVSATREELRLGTVLGLTQASILVLETYGVAHTASANAGLIISLTIVLTPVVDMVGRPDRLPPAFFAAALVCVAAVGLLMAGNGFHALRSGDLLMFAAAVVRAGHVSLVGRLTSGRDVRPMQITTVQTVVGTVVFLFASINTLPTLAHAGALTWFQLVYLALLCSVFAFVAQTWAVRHTSASRASLLLGTEPVWAVAVGVGLGGDGFTAATGAGAALMLVGTWWGQRVEQRHRGVGARGSETQGSGAQGSGAPVVEIFPIARHESAPALSQ